MLLSKLDITQDLTEWSINKQTPRKCYRTMQQHQHRNHQSRSNTKHQRHYSYYHHHHRIDKNVNDDNDNDGHIVMGKQARRLDNRDAVEYSENGRYAIISYPSWTTFLTIITIFIVSMHCQIANGAYINSTSTNSNSNSDSFNSVYSNNVNTSTAVDLLNDDYDSARSFIQNLNKLRRQPIYQNEFAVYIPKGLDIADSVAAKFGFTNMGQVS